MSCFLRESFADSDRGEPVENPELALAQALVDDRPRRTAGKSARPADDLGSLLCADIGRGENDLRSLLARESCKPAPRCFCLAGAKGGPRHVDIAQVDVDFVRAGFVG